MSARQLGLRSIAQNSTCWLRSAEAFEPDFEKSLRENGLGHKAVLRMQTPGLTGIGGTGN